MSKVRQPLRQAALPKITYMRLVRQSPLHTGSPSQQSFRLDTLFIMSESAHIVMQAAADEYVVSDGQCSLRPMYHTSVTINYIFIASIGRHNDCVQILANSLCCLKQLFWPMTAF